LAASARIGCNGWQMASFNSESSLSRKALMELAALYHLWMYQVRKKDEMGP